MTMSGVRQWGRLWLACWAVVTLLTGCWGFGDDDNDEAAAAPGAVAPVLLTQPSDAQAVAGGDARFTAAAQGTSVTWAWQRSTDSGTTWLPVANASTASLALTGLTLADTNTRYRAVASSAGLQTFSSAALLTVSAAPEPPRITVELNPQSVLTGSTVSFAVTATGTALQYQWQSSRDGNTWVDVAAATSATLQLQSVAFDANGTVYRVVVRNTLTSVTSAAVLLTVSEPPAAPAVTLQPLAAPVTAPNTATFTAAASGRPAPALQWQRSTNNGATYADIAGANQPSYTTGATTLADTGTLYRLVASNSVSTATSSAAVLTVSPTPAPPIATTQPADTTVLVGQTATFTAAFSGVPTPTLQWQFSADAGATFANINGATGSSYSVVLALGDSGKRYRVVATNSQGTVTSRGAVLTVAPLPSALQGRGWVPGSRFNSTADIVQGSQAAMDESGRLYVVYVTATLNLPANSAQWKLWAVSSQPGASASQASYGSPALLATSATVLVPSKLFAQADGGMAATWTGIVACAEDVNGCARIFSSAFDVANSTWRAAAEISSRELALLAGQRNASGDQAALVPTNGTLDFFGGYTLIWRQNGSSTIESMRVADASAPGSLAFTLPTGFSMDNSGRVAIVYSQLAPDMSQNLVVRRGSIRTATLGAEELLENRSAPATFGGMWSNSAGQTVVMWHQNNGTRDTEYAATLDSHAGTWSVVDTGLPTQAGQTPTATVTANGEFIWYSWTTCTTLRRTNGSWVGVSPLPTDLCAGNSAVAAVAVNGDVLVVDSIGNRWASFDAARQQLISGLVQLTNTGPGFVSGARWNSTSPQVLLSSTGIGAFVSVNNYDTLPSAAAPNGDSRGTGSSFQNVWGIYFK